VRPDVCLGDRDGTTCDPGLRRFVEERFRALGYGVSLNAPFKGSEIMRRYGSPATGTHSLQVEICKRLFMDEATGERGPPFQELQWDLTDIVRGVCSYATQQMQTTGT
jgi:N-formylglutamate amidohydrolase